jgi:hypothetical protein
VRYFLAYEPDKERAVELVRKRVPVNKGEEAEAVAEVAGNEFTGQNMRPGDVRRAPTSQPNSSNSSERLGCLAMPTDHEWIRAEQQCAGPRGYWD